MRKYLINSTVTYRVDTVEEVLELRDELQANPHGELISFSYTTKYIKSAGEVVGEYQVVKAKWNLTQRKSRKMLPWISFIEKLVNFNV